MFSESCSYKKTCLNRKKLVNLCPNFLKISFSLSKTFEMGKWFLRIAHYSYFLNSLKELVFIEYKLITLKYNGFCLQYFTWIICVLLSNKVSVLPNVKTDFNISMYCYYVILVMSYSYHKKILRPFSSQENFLLSKYFFWPSAYALYNFDSKISSQKKYVCDIEKYVRK